MECEKRFWRFKEEAGEGEVRLGVVYPKRFIKEGATNPVGVIFLD